MNREHPIKLGISRCLLGDEVRFDGGHKRDPFLVEVLGRYVEWVPVCPEVEAGLGTPREAMRLVGEPEQPRLITIRTNRDLTRPLAEFSHRRVRELEAEDLCGYVFKKDSPSCGIERVRLYNRHGMPGRAGVGVFARAFREHLPLTPIEEEGRLCDPLIRENFIERVFAYDRWRSLLSAGVTRVTPGTAASAAAASSPPASTCTYIVSAPVSRAVRFSGVSTATTRPRLMMTTLWQVCATSGRMWVLRTMV